MEQSDWLKTIDLLFYVCVGGLEPQFRSRRAISMENNGNFGVKNYGKISQKYGSLIEIYV